MDSIRILFQTKDGIGFYRLDARARKKIIKHRDTRARWVVLPPKGVHFLRLPESQADHWMTAAEKLTGYTRPELFHQHIEVYDVATGRIFRVKTCVADPRPPEPLFTAV